MGLKRKRSFISLSPSSVSSADSITAQHDVATSPTPFGGHTLGFWDNDTSMGGVESGSGFSHGFTLPGTLSFDMGARNGDAHLNSRTRKRFRDSRPEESVVHESTISKLFLAQRSSHHPHPSDNYPRPSSHPSSSTNSTQRPQQTSLHTFWALPRRPSSSRSTPQAQLPSAFDSVFGEARKCEDCDTVLSGAGVGHEDMDLDGCGEVDTCRTCRRVVCGMCAVVEVGVGRECLACRTR